MSNMTDNQCALNQAILLALHNDETDAAVIVTNAEKFLNFLQRGPAAGVTSGTSGLPVGMTLPSSPDQNVTT